MREVIWAYAENDRVQIGSRTSEAKPHAPAPAKMPCMPTLIWTNQRKYVQKLFQIYQTLNKYPWQLGLLNVFSTGMNPAWAAYTCKQARTLWFEECLLISPPNLHHWHPQKRLMPRGEPLSGHSETMFKCRVQGGEPPFKLPQPFQFRPFCLSRYLPTTVCWVRGRTHVRGICWGCCRQGRDRLRVRVLEA